MDIRSVFTTLDKGIDFQLDGLGLTQDNSLETLVITSLFTDVRAQEAEDDFKRGWWADALNQRALGSKLWLLKREKLTAETLSRAKHYAEQALLWMIDDGLISRIAVSTQIVKINNGETGVGGIVVELFEGESKHSFEYLWGKAA